MAIPSQPASNAIIYLTYGVFLCLGCYVAWRLRNQSKLQWLSSNRGPLALNFIASVEYLKSSSSRFWYPLHVSTDCHHCRCPRSVGLCTFFGLATPDLWGIGSHYQA
ncbi:hypothetical protein IAQ61_008398 [Plenodomus lingam]|uniref:uncharacterized protein n=1 Tax=Leptosphaeria maculans TaxID=5022 RepID=UPI00332C8F45|nr:hypothetical protein IAQ61_008398 [Plenodomus lingam]